MRLLAVAHPDRAGVSVGATANAARMSASINDAYCSIATPINRAETLLRLEVVHPAAQPALSPAFLVEMMELREALDDAIASANSAQVIAIEETARARREALISALAAQLDRAVEEPSPSRLVLFEAARRTLNELRYIERVLERAASDRYS